MSPKFIHLRLHSEYSIVDGIVRIKPLMAACRDKNMPAVAVTDLCNFFGLVKFYQAAVSSGIKPIVGCDFLLLNEANKDKPYELTVLCQNREGYSNATRLISKAYLEGQYLGKPLIKRGWLQELNAGLILLSGGCRGDIGASLLADDHLSAAQLLNGWQSYFPGRFYLEIQRTGREAQEYYLRQAVDFAQKNNTPLVATNDVRYLFRDDFDAHEARVCIQGGYILNDNKRPHTYSAQQYFRSQEEMLELFSDIPQALENTVEIAKRCNVELSLGQVFLPQYPVASDMTIEQYLSNECLRRMQSREFDAEKKEIYTSRLEYELNVINKMGFAGYFLIVADFIRWAKEHDIPVGPGRGSGAGSLVAYALHITDLDPIKHELLFERFLNPERVSMPDFDIDFCMEGRDRVIDYVAEKYGRDSVSQIITFGTMAARAVVRDVGRVLGHPYGYVDKIAKLIPFELGITLQKALEEEDRLADLYKHDEEVKFLLDLAMKLEGITRNAGKHAGGVVIAPSRLTDFAPLYCEEGGDNLVTQFDKNDVEAVGLVKFDFLGLRTLTIIHWALQSINNRLAKLGEPLVDINTIELNDKSTFDLLKSCQSTAVFQLESRGMRDLIRRLQPENFDDIVALVALFRPGPLQSGMVDDFIERKHGRAEVRYLHPALKSILKPTYGVILYQEQVMQIAQVLAGYSLGSADLLRRAMGKKKPEEMAKHRAIFIDGAANNNIDKHIANNIFDLMEKFAGYGFNKSHSAGYALISYQTAWLKAHYPAEFMAAVLSSDMDNSDKVVQFVEECKLLALKIIPPDINTGYYKFIADENGEIIYGLGAVKGAGEAAIECLTNEREAHGNFNNLFELCQRLDNRKVNKKVLEALIKSGAMDSIGPHRASLFASIMTALKAADQQARRNKCGQNDLFAEMMLQDSSADQVLYSQAKIWSDEERLQGENATLGFYFSGHPITKYEAELRSFTAGEIAKIDFSRNEAVIIAGFISAIKIINTKSGKKMAVVTIEDRSGHIDITVFSENYLQYRDLLIKGQMLVVEGDVNVDNFTDSYRIQARRIMSIVQAREEFAAFLLLTLTSKLIDDDFFDKLKTALKPFCPGKAAICINYQNCNASSRCVLGDKWRVCPTDNLLKQIVEWLGVDNCRWDYPKHKHHAHQI